MLDIGDSPIAEYENPRWPVSRIARLHASGRAGESVNEAEAAWLRRRLDEACAAFGGRVDDIGNGRLFRAGARTPA